MSLQLAPGDPPANLEFDETAGAVVTNYGPGTVSYADNPDVRSSADGTITSGSTATLTGSQWFSVTEPASISWRPLPVESSSGGSAHTLLTFDQPGSLTTAVGKGRVRLPAAATVVSVAAMVNTAPVGASVLVDVNKNGTTIFTTQGDRPSIAAGSNASGDAIPAVTAIAAGDYLTVDIDQVGSGTPGSDLTVVIEVLLATGVDPAPEALTVVIGQVTGLQDALDAAAEGGGDPAYRRLWTPAGAKIETRSRSEGGVSAQALTGSGTLRCIGGAVVPDGETISALHLVTGASSTTLTHLWMALVRASDRAVLAKTNDRTTDIVTNEVVDLTLSSPWVATAETPVYIALCCVAGGMPQIYGWSVAGVAVLPPIMYGTSTTGLTTPASLGGTAAALTVSSIALYLWGT